MKRRLLTVLSVSILALVASSAISAQSSQSDPRIGTWKLNVAKSKFDSAASRKSETRTYQMSDGAIMVHAETILGDGSKQEVSFNGTPDGKDHPYNATPAFYADTVSVRREGKGFIGESKKDGKILFTTTDSFSADGTIMTLTTKGVNAKGQPVNSVRVYEKQ